MSVTRARHSKSLAFTVMFAVILTLAIPFGGIAIAAHSGVDNSHTLDVAEETDTNGLGTTHTLTADVGIANCNNTCEVDFEVESGPTVRVNCAPQPNNTCTGGTSDSDNSPTSPDMTCMVNSQAPLPGQPTATSCRVFFTSDTQGDNIVRAWVDDDKDNASFDADQTEGRDHTAAGQGGSRTDPDDTDVVSKTWFSAATGDPRLDCDDAGTAGAFPASDQETNPVGGSEVYTCRAWTEGTGGTANQFDAGIDSPVSGMRIDAEHSGANDPDNRGFTDVLNITADYSEACTTGSDGTCTFTLTPTRNEVGVATVCFWLDEDNDAQYANGGGTFDGGDCATGENFDETEGTDRTDAVQKTWATGAAQVLDAAPERDSNVKGTSHTVTATVTDQFGNPIANTPVDFNIISGANSTLGRICNQVLTNASGVATCTYTDLTATVGSEPEQDTIEVCVDANADNNCDATDGAVDEATSAEFTNLGDRVEKFWFTTLPTAATIRVDMDGGPVAADCDDDDPTTDPNPVETNHDICGIALNASGVAVAGVNVNLTLSGPGFFTSGRGTNDRADDPNLGTSQTVTTDASGIWRATITSLTAGTTTVTATSGSATDTGTKTWTGLTDARTLDCEPETGTNPPGSEHVITCTALDRLGNPVSNEQINVQESGPGRFENATGNCTAGDNVFIGQHCVTTGSNGTAEIILTSTATEEGAQTVLAALNDDDDDATPLARAADETAGDECDRLAGDPAASGQSAAGPAGVCADEVTKTWGEPDLAECEDGVDNDGDGEIDFPDDRGCTSADDDDETGPFIPRACRNRGATENVIVGTSGADVLNGTSGRDIICGAGGDDIISGRGGNDLITGNGGNDTIAGGGGKDNISGNAGDDSISGGRGNDAIKGNGGNDAIKGNNGIDNLTGGRGSDTLQGGDKQDILRGGAGNDTLRGGKGDDALDGGPGNDQCFGNAGDDDIKNCE